MKNFSLDAARGIDVRAASMARSRSAALSDDTSSVCRMIPTDHELLQSLTPRELAAVRGIAMSQSTKEIAKRQGISPSTVDVQRQSAMHKLGLHDVAALTRFAVRTGLIQA